MDAGFFLFLGDLLILAVKSAAATTIALITLITLLGMLNMHYRRNGEYEKAAKVAYILESIWTFSAAIGETIGRIFKKSRKNRK